MATDIELSNITEGKLDGNGAFDVLMKSLRLHVTDAVQNNEITQAEAGAVYTGVIPSVIQQAVQYALSKDLAEKNVDAKQAQIDGLTQDVAKKTEDNAVLTATRTDRIAQVAAALAKTKAETSYVDEQETQLIASVGFNNKIKALDSMADTFGTFGAGGLTLSSAMWTTYFTIIKDLSDAAIPTSTTVTKVG